MPVKGEWIREGALGGYFAFPDRAALPLPGVVVIQEIGGVNANIEDITRRIAAAGYAAFAPDLFEVEGRRPEALSKERIEEAFAWMGTIPAASRFDATLRETELSRLPPEKAKPIGETLTKVWGMVGQFPAMIPTLRSSIDYLGNRRAETKGRKIGCVGFCMGGGLSALLSCEEPEIAGAAVFYGNAPSAEKTAQGTCPIIGFYGANDQRVNAGIPAFADAMKKAGRDFEPHVYPDANHAFFNDAGPSYEVNAARDSFARLLAFFAKQLAT